MSITNSGSVLRMSRRGQVTLPAEVRRALGMKGGDPLMVTVEDGRVVLTPVVVTPVERFTDDRIAEFEEAAGMSPDELEDARRRWGL